MMYVPGACGAACCTAKKVTPLNYLPVEWRHAEKELMRLQEVLLASCGELQLTSCLFVSH